MHPFLTITLKIDLIFFPFQRNAAAAAANLSSINDRSNGQTGRSIIFTPITFIVDVSFSRFIFRQLPFLSTLVEVDCLFFTSITYFVDVSLIRLFFFKLVLVYQLSSSSF